MKTTHRRTNRRFISLAALACCLLAAPLTERTAAAQRRPRVTVDPGGLFGGGKKSEVQVLLEIGPRLPAVYVISNFSADVLVLGRALMMVKYQLGHGDTATVKLTVKVKKEEKSFTKQLEPTGNEIKEEKFLLPEDFGKKPVVATLSVLAKSNDGTPADFELSGLCVGEEACGSIGIDQLRFQPARVRAAQKEKAAYSFFSRFDFESVYARFESLGRNSKGELESRLVKDQKISGVRRGESTGREWDGRDQKGKVSMGRHQLAVRAWYGDKKGGQWAYAWSDQRVIIE